MPDAPTAPTCTGPRERLVISGAQSLGDAELLAVVLGTGSAGEPVSVLAARLLEAAGGLENLDQMGVRGMSQYVGIGPSKACRVEAAFELGRRAAARPLWRGEPITCSRDIEAALRPRLAKASREHFIAIALDARNRPVAEVEVAVGGLNACTVRPADVFGPMLRRCSAAVVLVHNHPSGEPSPSPQDIAFTQRLRRAGNLMGIQVVDHIILGELGYFSFLDAGLLRAVGEEA